MAIGNHGCVFIGADLFGNSRQPPARERGRQSRAWGGAERNPRREWRFISPARERGRQSRAWSGAERNPRREWRFISPARERGRQSRAWGGAERNPRRE